MNLSNRSLLSKLNRTDKRYVPTIDGSGVQWGKEVNPPAKIFKHFYTIYVLVLANNNEKLKYFQYTLLYKRVR